MKLAMNRALASKCAVGSLVALLVVLMLCKPRVENGFHTAYLANLNEMQTLTGELQRDHLLVRQELVNHYDFLEADLQKMERAVQLAAYFPGFTGNDYQDQALTWLENYSIAVTGLREQVEVSKRSIGLLKNARMAFRRYLGELDLEVYVESQPQAQLLLNDLNYALVYQDLNTQWVDKAAELETLFPAAVTFIRPLTLHARMILTQQDKLTEASARLYATMEQMTQPDQLKRAYLEQYYAVVKITDFLLWGSYVIVALLLILCGVLTLSSRKAQAQSQRSTQKAQLAQAESERRIRETQISVEQCNEILARIGKGDFGHRLEGPFDEELETLRSGINDTADSVEFTMLELTRVMLAIQEGRFDVRLDSRVQGDFGQQVDQTIATLDMTIGDICRVMDNMRDGCFLTRVEAHCSGRLEELKVAVNSSMLSLESAIAAVVRVTEFQSQGDFSKQVETSGQGQIELLANAINATSAKVHEMVREIRQVSSTVALSSDSMQGNSRQLWEHTQSHSDSVGQLLERVAMVRESIQSNRDSVEQATSLVDCSQQAAVRGSGIAGEAICLMEEINDKSQRIDVITQVLDTIARQTNLLALNAAVEAARAKEHGSGFSVVANEVKQLARQSSEAATNITALVLATSQDIRSGSESVGNTGQALQDIGSSISDVEQATRTIVEQSRQQEQGMDMIVEIVSKSRTLMESDLKLADTTRETSASLGELAHRMNELLAFFKDGETTSIPVQERGYETEQKVTNKAA